jgi:hypothetical protein
LPAAQLTHADAPLLAVANVPARQLPHEPAPAWLCALPSSQATHVVDPPAP